MAFRIPALRSLRTQLAALVLAVVLPLVGLLAFDFGRSAESLLGKSYHDEFPEAAGTPSSAPTARR